MKTTLLILCWVLTNLALIGCVTVWLEFRFNMFGWAPKSGFFSVLPYIVIVTLISAAAIIPTAATSLGVLLSLLGIAIIPMGAGITLLPKEKAVGTLGRQLDLELEPDSVPDFLSLVRVTANAFNGFIKDNPDWLKRHEGETSPFWFRFHRFVLLIIPFLIAAYHLWRSELSGASIASPL